MTSLIQERDFLRLLVSRSSSSQSVGSMSLLWSLNTTASRRHRRFNHRSTCIRSRIFAIKSIVSKRRPINWPRRILNWPQKKMIYFGESIDWGCHMSSTRISLQSIEWKGSYDSVWTSHSAHRDRTSQWQGMSRLILLFRETCCFPVEFDQRRTSNTSIDHRFSSNRDQRLARTTHDVSSNPKQTRTTVLQRANGNRPAKIALESQDDRWLLLDRNYDNWGKRRTRWSAVWVPWKTSGNSIRSNTNRSKTNVCYWRMKSWRTNKSNRSSRNFK